MEHVQVEIITIGDEILIGQIVDTNSAWMAVELNKNGFEVAQITSVHDDKNQIIDALNSALKYVDVVLFTGGIGPTKDDITKLTLCEYFDTKLVFNEAVYKNIQELFKTRPYVMNELTKSQANVPENCIVIQNRMGTAPITWFEKDGKVIVSMPGVPYEMKNVMSTEIIPRLREHFQAPNVLHKTLLVAGYPESQLALKIADWENALPNDIHLAYLPHYGIIKLRLSAVADDVLALDFLINQQIDLLKEILGNAIVAFEDTTIERLVSHKLIEAEKTLSIAESCTGGNIAHHLTLLPGSSALLKGGIVAYSNEVKVNVLKVSVEDINLRGAVSKEVVEQMAQNARKLFKTHFAIATSGIAGPSGGSDEKPVGTVWIAACSADTLISRKYQFGPIREQNIERATQAALLLLNEII